MPTTALKHLAKKAKISLDRAEHLWDKSKEIVDAEYPYDKKDERYWALRMGITKKMMGLGEKISFTDFLALNEAAVKNEPNYAPVQVKQAVDMLNKHAKDALWMLYDNEPFYRGDGSKTVITALKKTGFVTVDSSATERRSENTTNYYTVLLDNHPQRSAFPKRSRSFIGSTDYYTASDFADWGSDNGFMIMIPFDGTKIGIVHRYDIWDSYINIFGKRRRIEDANNSFDNMGIDPNIKSFEAFASRLKSGDTKTMNEFRKEVGTKQAEKYAKTFMDELWKGYSAEVTGHTAHTTKTLPRPLPKTEVWVGGKVMLISEKMWMKMREALN